MKHPLLSNYIRHYLIFWGMVVAGHVFILQNFYEVPFNHILAEVLLFSGITAAIGFCYWWVVRFLSSSENSTTAFMGILITVCLGAAAVIYLNDWAIYTMLESDEAFEKYREAFRVGKPVISGLLIGLIVSIYFLLVYMERLSRRERNEAELQTQVRQAELDMLKFQLNPHFIFNSLNSISSLTLVMPDKARSMVIKLSSFLRSSLGSGKEELQTLKEELDMMNTYLDIEKVRFEDRLNVELEISGSCDDLKVPNMILQPLYENAIKYGIYGQLDEVNIHTKVDCSDGNLRIMVSNNYDSEAIPKKGKGIGLKNVRNRLELIYGLSDLVTIEKQKSMFSVHLLIPQLK